MGIKKGQKVALVVFIGMVFLVAMVAATNQKIILNLMESKVINGKNITFLGVIGESANIKVDGTTKTIDKGKTDDVSGVYVQVEGLAKNPPVAILNITINFNCGDKKCDLTKRESFSTCCRDCGCSGSKSCVNNICLENISLPEARYECYLDGDCKVPPNTIACIRGKCDTSVIPHKCTTMQITACTDNDACCPLACTDKNDKDCTKVDQCSTARECDDDNPCTAERCDGKPKKCTRASPMGCVVEGACMSFGEKKGVKYCGLSGELNFLKDVGAACEEKYECLTNNCRGGACAQPLANKLYFYAIIAVFLICVITIVSYFYISIKRKGKV